MNSLAPETEAKIVHGDIAEMLDAIPDEQFSLIVTSPPYNLGKSYERKQNLESYLDWQKTVITGLTKKLTPNGSIVWQVGNYIDKGEVFPLDIYFYPIFKSLGFSLRNRIIWHFEHGLHCKKRFSGRYETLLWFTKTDEYVFNLDAVRVPSKYPGKLYYKGPKKGLPSGNPLGKNPSDFWTMLVQEFEDGIVTIPNVKCNHPEKTCHPCQFPVELVERCVLAFTNPGDWVLDPFGGVGSTLIAALKRKRNALMVELDAKYAALAHERVALFRKGLLRTRALGTAVYTPTGREKVAQIPLSWKSLQPRTDV